MVKKYLFKDGENIKKYGSILSDVVLTTNAVTTMTSNTSPSPFVVTCSSENSSYKAWQAFDKSNTTSWASGSTTNNWIQYKFDSPIIVGEYSITNDSYTNEVPKSWRFQGSNDGTDFVTLNTQTNISFTTSGQKKNFSFTNSTAYLYYRITIDSIYSLTGSYSSVSIREIEIFKYSEITGWGTIEKSPAKKSMFDTHGMTDLSVITNEIIQKLDSDVPELLCLTDESMLIPPTVNFTMNKLTFQTVSPTLPTLAQFQEEGMDDLSIFDRKVQTVLESPKVMTSEVLGVGKVFKASIDLNKYFDLRKIEVK